MPRSGGTWKLVCLVGAYRDQLLDYPVHVAQTLLDTGQARRPTEAELEDEGSVAETATMPPAEERDVAPEPKPEPEWTLKSTPEEYLERYGDDAANSDLARRVLEARG